MAELTLFIQAKRQIEDEVSLHWPDADINFGREKVIILHDDETEIQSILDHLIQMQIFDPHEDDHIIDG